MSLQAQFSQSPVSIARKANIIGIPPAALPQLIENLCQALETNPENASEIALGFLGRIASCDLAGADSARGGLAPWQKRRVERYLSENLEHAIRMDELARAVRLSISHFSRAFKKSFGETPHAYLVRLRLALAQKLMLTTAEPLSQIALSCGLADQAHLSKLFRRAFDDTPNAWRRRNLTDSQAERCQLAKAGMRHAA